MAAVKASKCFSASLLGESVCSTICSINCFLFTPAVLLLAFAWCGSSCHLHGRTRGRRPRKHARDQSPFRVPARYAPNFVEFRTGEVHAEGPLPRSKRARTAFP